MRQYRGLTKEGKWVYGWYMEIEGIHYIVDNTVSHTWLEEDCYEVQGIIEVIPETVGQSTSLKDKTGKELDWWEDDLLRKGSDHSCAPIGRIVYDPQKAQWVIVGRAGGEFCGLLQAHLNGWKKIGNVHQNSKLLEKP